MSFITHRFTLHPETQDLIRSFTPNFGFNNFGATVYMRPYSRQKANGGQETWGDTVLRVTEGVFSIRKDHFIRNHLRWVDTEWQDYARQFAIAMYNFHFLPPGRGLWACGTDFCYQRGSASLNNCGACSTKDLVEAAYWTFDMLMYGVGVGFSIEWEGSIRKPNKKESWVYEIPDSREGWCESLCLLLKAYLPDEHGNVGHFPQFDYGKIRSQGTPIKGFGGTASGPDPLIKLHRRAEVYLDAHVNHTEGIEEEIVFCHLVMQLRDVEEYWFSDLPAFVETVGRPAREGKKRYDRTRLVADVMNAIGCSVVAGGVRRSSQLILGQPDDATFINLKNYDINPERGIIGWMSNNTIRLVKTEDFHSIPSIATRIQNNGEPGILNQLNVTRYGRVGRYHRPGDTWTRELEQDQATLCNPCVTADTEIFTIEGWTTVWQLMGMPFSAVVDGKEYPSTKAGFWHTGKKPIFRLTLSNGMTLKATGNHEIYTMRGKIAVASLLTSDIVELPDHIIDSAQVQSVEPCGEDDVYDCTIQEIHCFNANGMKVANCGEIPLESFELCNLVEIFPSRCFGNKVSSYGSVSKEAEVAFLNALEFGTFYASTVSLLPTHCELTNRVIARNRRIGVSLSGIAEVYDKIGFTELTRLCRLGYKKVRELNTRLAQEAGVPPSIRVTCIKPAGTLSQLVGVSSGMHFPHYRYAIRRMRISVDAPLVPVLRRARYPCEKDKYSDNTLVFEFPIEQEGARPSINVNMWEQFGLLAMLTREWSDNMVSCTIMFNPDTEGHQIEYALGQFAPVIKSVSMLPNKTDAYEQTPYEEITKEQYEERLAKLKPIDWSSYCGSDGELPRFCTNDTCTL